jgi:hypothetical protein
MKRIVAGSALTALEALDLRVVLGALLILGCLGYLIARDQSIVEFRCLVFSWRRRTTEAPPPAPEPLPPAPQPARRRAGVAQVVEA